MYESIPVPVPRREHAWWKKNRVYPVTVELDFDTMAAKIGGRAYRLIPLDDGYAAAIKVGERVVEAGRFCEHRVYRTLSIGAMRDLKALRSAVYNTDYRLVLAVRTDAGLTHAGACAKKPGELLYTVKDELELESRCLTCGEGFE